VIRTRRSRTVAGLVGATLALAFTLVFTPGLYSLPGFRSHFGVNPKHLTPSPVADLLPLGIALAVLARGAALASRGRKRAAAWLMVSLCLLVWGFAWLEGRGAGRLSETLVGKKWGHSEFVVLAMEGRSLRELASTYEERRAHDSAMVFARSKPPGHLLVYAAIAGAYRFARAESWGRSIAERLRFHPRPPYTEFAVFAVLVLLLLAAVPVPLLQAAGTRLGGATVGGYSALVWCVLPAVLLVTMHLDQALYPALVAGAMALTLSLPTAPLLVGIALGALATLSIYISFSLIAIVPIVLLLGGICAARSGGGRLAWMRGAAAAVGGALVTLLALMLALGFEPVRSYRSAMAFHASWVGAAAIQGPAVTLRNLVEFAVWLGPPATLLWASGFVRAARVKGRRSEMDLLCLLYPGVLLLVSTFGHTRNEIGRLWIPFMVPIVPPIAREIEQRLGRNPWPFVATSLATTLLLKAFKDFA
jgi:hypothetical protein